MNRFAAYLLASVLALASGCAAVPAQHVGVLETFGGAAQKMLQSIAIKDNLKDKGLDPAAVPELVAAALKVLAGKAEDVTGKTQPKSGPGGKPASISPSKRV